MGGFLTSVLPIYGAYRALRGRGEQDPAAYNYDPQMRRRSFYEDPNSSFYDPYDMLLANYYDAVGGAEGQQARDNLRNQGNAYWDDFARYREGADNEYGYPGGIAGGGYLNTQAYTPDERAAISRYDRYRAARTGDEDWGRTYLSPEEQAAISGDPYSGYNLFQSQGLDTLDQLNRYDENLQRTLGEGGQRLRGVGAEYKDRTGGTLESGAGAIRQAVYRDDLGMDPAWRDSMEARAGGLEASPEFMRDYRFGPADTAKLETDAGAQVGTRYRNMRDDILTRAAARGTTDPMALAAFQARSEAEAAREAADAGLGASVQARGLELETTRGREDARMAGAARSMAARSELEGMRQGAAYRQAQLQADAEAGLMDRALGVSGRLADINRAAESDLLHSGLTSASDLARQRQQSGQWYAEGLAGAHSAAEGASSQRAAALAGARREAQARENEGRYKQTMDFEDRQREAEKAFADNRLKFDEERRRYLAGQMQGSREAGQANAQQQAALWQARQQARQQAAGAYGDYRYRNEAMRRGMPGRGERIFGSLLGAATGAASAYAGGG